MHVTKKFIKENPVKAAAAIARPIDVPSDPDEARKLLATRRRELVQAESLRRELLPVEESARRKATEKIEALRSQIDALATVVCTPALLPIFDLECLRWRNDKGFPHLAIFKVDETSFALEVVVEDATDSWGVRRTRLANASTVADRNDLEACYRDVYQTLRQLRASDKKDKERGIEITATFTGAIPDHVRDLIAVAQGMSFGDNLYIVAQVSDWKVTRPKRKVTRAPQPTRTVEGDPLLVGWDGQRWRLIAEFDTTDIEKLAADRSRGKKPS